MGMTGRRFAGFPKACQAKKKKKNVEKGQGANVQAERLEPDQN